MIQTLAIHADALPRLQLPLRRFTLQEYRQLSTQGVFAEDEPVELLDGWIVEKMTRNPPHDATFQRTNYALIRILPQGWQVRVQSAITVEGSEPEPDVAVVLGPPERYDVRHPGPDDIGMLG